MKHGASHPLVISSTPCERIAREPRALEPADVARPAGRRQRNGSLPDLVTLLREQRAAKLDVVIPAAGVRSSEGRWRIDGTGVAILDPDGVTTSPGTFVPTGTCDAGMAEKLGIPVGYLRRLREEHVGLYDANVNGWLEHQPGRRLLIRTLRGAGGDGIARAVLSERYRFVDNLDVLLAVLGVVT